MAKNDDVYYPPVKSSSAKSSSQKSGAVSMSAAHQEKPLNVMALIGFILSVVGFFSFITAVPGIILGHIALKQIRTTHESGHGLAVAALAVGYSVIGFAALALFFVALAFFLLPLLFVGSDALFGSY